MLRDRIVCRINNPRIQHCLLAEPELTYKSVFELVQSMETAEQNTASCPPWNELWSRQEEFHYTPRAATQSHTHKAVLFAVAAEETWLQVQGNTCSKKGHLPKVWATAETPRNQKRWQQTNSHHLWYLIQKRTLTPQKFITWMRAQMKMNTIYCDLRYQSTFDSFTYPYLIMEIDTGAARSVISDV